MKTLTSELRGTFTALVTPFNRDGSIDVSALDALVDHQLAAGITGLVPCGTTGEAATLSANERDLIIKRVAQRVNGKVPVIAGTGSNCTTTTIDNQRRALACGATCGLVVTPYYNKPTPEGLVRHYAAVAEAIDLPIVVYNVPSRTSCDLKPDVMARLRTLDRIVGIKEATGDLDRVAALREARSDWTLLSGDDATTCAFILMGGDGVISVVSNVVPHEMVTLVNAARAGHISQALTQHRALRQLMSVLFVEANPIPVKGAMAMQKRLHEHYRLPLCEMQASTRTLLTEVMKSGGWL